MWKGKKIVALYQNKNARDFSFFRYYQKDVYNEHNPPHFHAYYNEFQAEILIDSFEIIKGELPKKVYTLVVEWALEHRVELKKDWDLMRNDLKPNPINPLV